MKRYKYYLKKNYLPSKFLTFSHIPLCSPSHGRAFLGQDFILNLRKYWFLQIIKMYEYVEIAASRCCQPDALRRRTRPFCRQAAPAGRHW